MHKRGAGRHGPPLSDLGPGSALGLVPTRALSSARLIQYITRFRRRIDFTTLFASSSRPLFARLFQFPIPFGEDLLLTPASLSRGVT